MAFETKTIPSQRLRPRDAPARIALVALCLLAISACGTRQVQDSLAGATAQRLVAHAIDDLAARLPTEVFNAHRGQRLHLDSHFLRHPDIQRYADQRLTTALQRRFDISVVEDPAEADVRLDVFYTALGTDQSQKGFYLPFGAIPGVPDDTQINLITLEQFHGVAEIYYFIGPTGTERRGDVIQARTRSDAIGLPVITIPVSDIRRQGEGGD